MARRRFNDPRFAMQATFSLSFCHPPWSTKPTPRSQHARKAFKAGKDSDDAVVDDRRTSTNLALISCIETTPVKSSSQLSKTRQPPLSKTSFTWRTARPQRGVNGIDGGGGASLCDDAVCPMGASALFGGRGCGAFVWLMAGGAVAASGRRRVGFAPRARPFWAGVARRPLPAARTLQRGVAAALRAVRCGVGGRWRTRRPGGRLVILCTARGMRSGGHFGVFGGLQARDRHLKDGPWRFRALI